MDPEAETHFRYVYILESLQVNGAHYTGLTDNLRKRLAKHNAGEVPHTSKFKPWRVKTAIAFSNPSKAASFEQYLKSGSGRAFAKRHL
jgi:predicted GIY-YIG superfamily endonuclease